MITAGSPPTLAKLVPHVMLHGWVTGFGIVFQAVRHISLGQ